MPYQSIALTTAFVGSIVSAAWDLKTTEIPDKIPYLMVAVALITYGVQSYVESNYWILLDSIIVGASLWAFGFLLYYAGQWGGGDANLLAAIGFLIPRAPQGFVNIEVPFLVLPNFLEIFVFPAVLVLNLFLVGALYTIGYALVMAMLNKKILVRFNEEIKSNFKIILSVLVGTFALASVFNFWWSGLLLVDVDTSMIIGNFVLSISLTSMFLLILFAKSVEEVGFRKKIPISQLKVGDVPMHFKVWDGITEDGIRKLKKSGKKTIWIKDGVRFAPSFPLALFFTLLAGNGIVLIFASVF